MESIGELRAELYLYNNHGFLEEVEQGAEEPSPFPVLTYASLSYNGGSPHLRLEFDSSLPSGDYEYTVVQYGEEFSYLGPMETNEYSLEDGVIDVFLEGSGYLVADDAIVILSLDGIEVFEVTVYCDSIIA
jgi:hypothetical protein